MSDLLNPKEFEPTKSEKAKSFLMGIVDYINLIGFIIIFFLIILWGIRIEIGDEKSFVHFVLKLNPLFK